MQVHHDYGAIAHSKPTVYAGRTVSTRNARRAAFAGLVVCALGLVALAGWQHSYGNQASVLFYHVPVQLSPWETNYHGPPKLSSWEGAGAGGSTGGTYHWTAHSFSPITGKEIEISFTHNHNSYGNYNGSEGWTVGAHNEFPVQGTRPAGWLDQPANATEEGEEEGADGEKKEEEPAEAEEAPAAPAEGEEEGAKNEEESPSSQLPQRWPYQNMTGYDYFAKIFPVYKGYSSYIFGNATVPNATNETEAVLDTEEVAEGEAQEDARLRGVKSPMVFNDMPDIGGFPPIQKSNNLVKVKWPKWWIA